MHIYLGNRLQYVCFNGVNSDRSYINCGVPQGSILGPTLFIMYVNDMCNASMLLESILFTDDTSLFCKGRDVNMICETVSTELNELNTSFKVNKHL